MIFSNKEKKRLQKFTDEVYQAVQILSDRITAVETKLDVLEKLVVNMYNETKQRPKEQNP